MNANPYGVFLLHMSAWLYLLSLGSTARDTHFHLNRAPYLKVCLLLMTCLGCVVVRGLAVNTLPPCSTIEKSAIKLH